MNETQKTGIFWGVAGVVALIAAIIAWPTSIEEGMGPDAGFIGGPLFPEFKDPLNAASLKIVTFNEGQGELKNFEVRKDPETGLWTIPSKSSYPADAIEQMRDAANALVALNVLDVPTSSPEDHVGMGVVEPKLEDLDPGDEGVGRLVTLKDESQKVLASVIVGNEVKGQEGQVYVRKPGQDPVYVVKLDDKPLSTKFQDWIEEDLLQLSSIDVENVVVKDYNASLGLQGVSLERNYEVSLAKDGSQWTLDELNEFDKDNPLAEPTTVEVDPSAKLNSQKLNDLANALDDLKFVDVKRKPEGISANLKADQDFATDNEAASQLASRGFIPVPLGPNREIEILSANGELTATTKEGVQYILRFGNISGISEGESDGSGPENADGEADGDASGGVNRYLMVSTVVDESMFPVPELKPIPQTLEDLEALDKPAPPPGEVLAPELNEPEQAAQTESEMKEGDAANADAAATESDADGSEPTAEKDTSAEKDTVAEKNTSAEQPAADDSSESPQSETPQSETDKAGAASESGATDASGEGESTTVGEGQEAVEGSDESDTTTGNASDEPAESGSSETENDKSESVNSESVDQPEDPPAAKSDTADTPTKEEPASEQPEETEEEKLERLAAVQEKITKENQRKLEERKEQLEQARIASKKLNERFADWYYVIPEATYSKLRISRQDLFDTSDDNAEANPGFNPAAGPGFPNFQMPSAPGN